MGSVGGVYCPFLALTNIFWFVSFRLSTNYCEVISECDVVRVLALPGACNDDVLTFAVYMREYCCVRVCVCCLFSSVSWHFQSVGLVTNIAVIKTRNVFKHSQDRISEINKLEKSIKKINT